jgi:hypothetical protein
LRIQDVLVAVVFGFGFAFLSLGLAVFGILKDKYGWVLIGAVIFAPFSYYLFGASRASVFALLPILLQFGSAAAVHRRNRLWAWIFLAPSFLITLWVLIVALLANFAGR